MEKQIMQVRADAAQATLNRFRDQPFTWGKNDCARMVAFHLRQLGFKPQLSKAGTYKTALSARRALARAGFANLPDAIDALGLPRIAPAAALVGDIVQLEADSDLGALFVAVGNGRVLGYHEAATGAVVMQPTGAPLAAWRTLPHG